MTRIVLILGLLVNMSAFGGNYVAESELCQDGAKVYPDASSVRCQAEKGESCYDLTSKACDEYSVQSVSVDDPSKPLYGPKLKSSPGLSDLATCQAAMAGHCDDQSPGYEVRPVCAIEGAGPTHELYCAAVNPQSYEQMSVNRLLPDSAKQAAKAAARAAALQLETDVKNAARACYIKHRDGTAVAGDVIPCQKALYDFVREILQQLN